MAEQHDSDDRGENSIDESLSPFVKAYIDEQIENSKKAEELSRKKRWKNSWRSASPITKGTFCLTASVAVATIAYAIIAAFQLSAMRHTNRLTQSALDKAAQNSLDSSKQFQAQLGHFDDGLGRTGLLAAHAGEQVNETHTLAQTSKDALVSVQRAFIFATGLDSARIADPKDPTKIGSLEFSITWENNGTTPTRHMSTHFNWLTPNVALPDDFTYPDLGNIKPTPIALGPKTIGHTTPPIQISAADIAAVINRQKRLYIWGWARYQDIFSKTKPHITRFCTEITGFQGNPLDINAASRPVMVNCAGNNCYDDECKVQ